MPRLSFEAVPRALDANGNPISYAKLRVYVAGSTTPVTTYSDVALTTAQTVPVLADSSGTFPEIYLPAGAYKVRIQTPSGSLVQEADWVVSSADGLSFQTVAALKASGVLHAGAYVSTQGFYTPGDRGAAQYLIVTDDDFPGSPNGYSDHAITGTSLVAKLVPGPTVNAAQFGADLTGAASAVAAVSAMLDYVNVRGGGLAFLPAGDYRWDGSLTKQGLNGVILEGEGNRTKLIRYGNQGAAIRFWGGANNRIRSLLMDCQGYAGRGIYLQDRFSGIEDCECNNCPNRPFAMNGGGNASFGLDSAGRNSDDAGFTTATFFPTGCWIDGCRVTRAGETAFSQKRMFYSRITHCTGITVYSEGATADLCSYSVIEGNTLLNVGLINTAEWPNLDDGGTIAGAGGGGVGGIGIDAATGVRVVNNTIIGVDSLTTPINDRRRAAINVVNNLAASFSTIIANNHIESAKTGIWLKGTGAGAAGGTFRSSITGNTFKDMGTGLGVGTSLQRFGAIWIDALNNPNYATGNTQIGTDMILTDQSGNNWVDSLDWATFTPVLTIGGASTGITYGTQSGRYQRAGRRVFFEIKIVLTAKGSLTGALKIAGLPVLTDANTISPTADLIWICPGATVPVQPWAMVDNNATTISLFADRSDTTAYAALTEGNLSATQTILLRGSYEV